MRAEYILYQMSATSSFTETCTITFGDVAENHVGMQKVGVLSKNGFDLADLSRAQKWFSDRGCITELISLHKNLPEGERDKPEHNAYILIIRKAVDVILGESNSLFAEQAKLKKDTKAFMYGRVVNKHARHNLCFGEISQEPNYEAGQGRIYAFSELPYLRRVREMIPEIIGATGTQLQAEGNYYFDLAKCGIGFHGDTERKKVIAIRLGAVMPLHYSWFKNNTPVGEKIIIADLGHGDMYIMSEKATGCDWKRKSIYTLRHSAGCEKFTTLSKNK